MSLLTSQRRTAADAEFESFDFGFQVRDGSGWEHATPGNTWTKPVYFESETDDFSIRGDLIVVFHELTAEIAESHATVNGQLVQGRSREPLEARMMNEHGEPVVVAFINGHTIGNPGPGGWGLAILTKGGSFQELSGTGLGPVTNNQMELLGAISLFSRLDRRTEVVVYADSQYLINGMTEYLAKWKERAWRTSDGKAVKNEDFWILLDRLASPHRVTWNWIPGHVSSKGNEIADRLAQNAANTQLIAA